MTAGFGAGNDQVVTPEQRELTTISQQPGPDVNTDFTQMIQKHDYEIKFLASQMKQTQQGVQEANQNPIQQIQQFIADIVVLLGGFELPKGALDFGDFKYVLQALGALFGFNSDGQPVNLFSAAEKLFFGYIVPGAQYADLVDNGIRQWGAALGIDQPLIDDTVALNDALDDFATAVGDVFNGVAQFLQDLFTPTGNLGPIGEILAPFMRWLLKGADLTQIGASLDGLLDLLKPGIEALTRVVNGWSSTLELLSGQMLYAGADFAAYIRDQFLAFDGAIVQIVEWVASWFGLELPKVSIGGSELCPPMSASTTDWQLSTDPAVGWVFDATQSYESGPGSFYTTGNGIAKRMLNQTAIPCFPGQQFYIYDYFQWSGLSVDANVGAVLAFFDSSGGELPGAGLPIGPASSSTGWTLITEQPPDPKPGMEKLFGAVQGISRKATPITAPAGAASMRVGVYIDSTVTSGTVRVGAMSCKNRTFVTQQWVDGVISWVQQLPTLLGELTDILFTSPSQIRSLIFAGIEASLDALIDWLTKADTGTDALALFGQALESFVHDMLWPDGRTATWLADGITAVMAAWRTYVTASTDQFVGWVLNTFFSWAPAAQQTDLHAVINLFFHLLEPSAWLSALTALSDFVGWLVADLTGEMLSFFEGLADFVAKFTSKLFDWIAYPVLTLFGLDPTPTVGGVVWTPTRTLLRWALGQDPSGKTTPSSVFTIVAGLADLFTHVWKLLCALWDYFLGGSLYSGTAVTPFSPAAGADLSAAFAAFWGVVAPAATAVPSAAAATIGRNFLTYAINASGNPAVAMLADTSAWIDGIRKQINRVLNLFHLGHLDSSWAWVTGDATAADLPSDTVGSLGSIPDPWLPGVHQSMPGTSSTTDLPSQLDSTIPAAPHLNWPIGGSFAGPSSVPQGVNLYYMVTAVSATAESATSNVGMVYSSPAWLVPFTEVTLSWGAVPGVTGYSIYRRIGASGQWRKLTSVSGSVTSWADTLASAAGTVVTPGDWVAKAAPVINTISNTATAANVTSTSIQAVIDPYFEQLAQALGGYSHPDTATNAEAAISFLASTLNGMKSQLISLTQTALKSVPGSVIVNFLDAADPTHANTMLLQYYDLSTTVIGGGSFVTPTLVVADGGATFQGSTVDVFGISKQAVSPNSGGVYQYTLSATISLQDVASPGAGTALIAGYVDANNYVYARIYTNTNGVGFTGEMGYVAAGVTTILKTLSLPAISPNISLIMGYQGPQGQIAAQVGGVVVATAQVPSSFNLGTSHKVGWRVDLPGTNVHGFYAQSVAYTPGA